MAFLDNSGDIILDAVLTDTGRYRLAKGDGSFKIVKFALGDDEIDYSLYDKENPSGSVYYDLNILQTPILEAFTDNASALKSHLLTINQTDLLYLPVIKLFEGSPSTKSFLDAKFFAVAVDASTEEKSPFNLGTIDQPEAPAGVFYTDSSDVTKDSRIELHQGIDADIAVKSLQDFSQDLVESMFMIEMDSRFGFIKMEGESTIRPSYIDDDQIATYIITRARNPMMVDAISVDGATSLLGPRGSKLAFQIGASMELQTSTYLFQQLGFISGSSPSEFHVLDSNIRITGATTGYRVDIPVRFYKYKTP